PLDRGRNIDILGPGSDEMLQVFVKAGQIREIMGVPARLLPAPHSICRKKGLQNSSHRLLRNAGTDVALDALLDVVRKNNPFGAREAESCLGLASGCRQCNGGVGKQVCHLKPVLPRRFEELLGYLRRGDTGATLVREEFLEALKARA